MSSVYRLLCLAHDPAIVLDQEWHSGSGTAIADALAAVADPPPGHAGCDLIVGRYSYPLIEVCCPGGQLHRDPKWIDAGWLRLLLAAQELLPPEVIREVARGVSRCWHPPRLARLRYELRYGTLP